jgi:hypothetical protein
VFWEGYLLRDHIEVEVVFGHGEQLAAAEAIEGLLGGAEVLKEVAEWGASYF